MSSASLVYAAVLPPLAAYLATRRLWGEGARDPAVRVLRGGLSLPLGLGGASLVTYAWLMGGGTLGRAYAIADAALFAALAVAAWGWGRARPPEAPTPRLRGRDVASIAVAGAVLLFVAAAFAQETASSPHGAWDAWAIWNQRARFLIRAGDEWRIAFGPSLAYSHPGYPLLLPGAVARLWAHAGETVAAPAIVSAAFTFAAPVIVLGAVAHRAGWAAGATASSAVVAARSWLTAGPSQYADVPLACLVAAGAAAAAVAVRRDGTERGGMYAVAGALLALAAWTKDEGLLLGGLFAAWAILAPGSGSRRRRAVALAAGAALPLAARASFQLTLAPGFASVFTARQDAGSSLGRLLDPERWAVILSTVPAMMPGAEVALPALVLLAAIVFGGTWRGVRTSPLVPAVAAVAPFLAVYAVTPLDLSWHLSNSASRVLLQPWPAFVLGAFLLVPSARRAARQAAPSDPSEDAAAGGPAGGALDRAPHAG